MSRKETEQAKIPDSEVVPTAQRSLNRLIHLFLVFGLLLTSLLPAFRPVAAQNPKGQLLTWPNGSTFANFGPNATVMIEAGRIQWINTCPGGIGNDLFYAWADVYVVPSGSVSDGAALADVDGLPNTIRGGLGGAFGLEIIGFTQPDGNLPAGTFAVVYDECQNGKFEADQDGIFDPAFSVNVPANLPALPNSAISAIKDSATESADDLAYLVTYFAEISAAHDLATRYGDHHFRFGKRSRSAG